MIGRFRTLYALACAAALFAGCDHDHAMAGGDGGGMETTNGITARIRIPDGSYAGGARVKVRRSDFISGSGAAAPGRDQGRDTVTDAAGRFEVAGLAPGSYTVEVFSGDLGWVAQSVRVEADSMRALGEAVLSGTGTLKGFVNVENLPPGLRVRLGIYGLERAAEARDDGSYAFPGLAPASYEVRVFSDTVRITGEAAVFASIQAAAETHLDSVFLPLDFRTDSLSISAFLARQGIKDFDWATRTTAYANRIRTLRLNGLGLTGLDPSIGRLTSIHSLYLHGNPLAGLPDTLRRLNLQILNLDSIPLAALPPPVTGLKRLRQLSIAHTGIKELPASLAGLPLAYLDLEGNDLDTMPGVVSSLASLTYLKVNRNPRLGTFPAGMAALKALEQFYAFDAGLDSLPAWITELPGLTLIHAFGNRMAALPDSIGRLSNLKVLAVGDNRLTALPASIGRLKSLTALKLAQNRLEDLPPAITAIAPRDVDVTGNSLCAPDATVAAWLDERQPGWRAKQKGCP